jgi:hypothetical protein
MADPDYWCERRHIIIAGDGAIAMTTQELSTLLREGCAPLLVVLNNGQYVVEDLAVGQQMQANKIWVWDYSALAAGFDDHGAHQPLALRVSTDAELADGSEQTGPSRHSDPHTIADTAKYEPVGRPYALSRDRSSRLSSITSFSRSITALEHMAVSPMSFTTTAHIRLWPVKDSSNSANPSRSSLPITDSGSSGIRRILLNAEKSAVSSGWGSILRA